MEAGAGLGEQAVDGVVEAGLGGRAILGPPPLQHLAAGRDAQEVLAAEAALELAAGGDPERAVGLAQRQVARVPIIQPRP